MTILMGTPDGLYAAPDGDTVDPDLVLDVPVNRVRRFEGHGVLAATDEGVYQSVGGRAWNRLTGFDGPAVSVLGTPDGTVFAGTRAASVYRSPDGGSTWEPLDLGVVAVGDRSVDRAVPEGARVRTLACHPSRSERVFAGVDPGGIVVSADGGESWTRRSRGCHDGVHHLLVLDDEQLVASTGDGCFRTGDGGETWARLETGSRCNDHREATVHDWTLFAAARARGRASPGAVVLAYDGCDPFGVPERVEPPGAPGEFVRSFASHMGGLLAGTMRQDEGFRPHERARVAVRQPGGDWETLGRTPAGVRSLVAL